MVEGMARLIEKANTAWFNSTGSYIAPNIADQTKRLAYCECHAATFFALYKRGCYVRFVCI